MTDESKVIDAANASPSAIAPSEVVSSTIASIDDQQLELSAPSNEILRDLVVLPPRQQRVPQTASGGKATHQQQSEEVLALPPIRAEEPVQSIKAALAEVVGLAQITNYRLELELPPSDPSADGQFPKRVPYSASLISPYVGKKAIVAQPIATKAIDDDTAKTIGAGSDLDGIQLVLDDWSDLSPLLAVGLCNGAAFRMVLQRYDAASVKDHVMRLRSLLYGNTPAVVALLDDELVEMVSDSGAKGTEENKSENANAKTVSSNESSTDGATPGQLEKPKDNKDVPLLPEYVQTIDASKLKDFFYLACGEDPKAYHDSELTKAKKKKKKRHADENGATHGNNLASSFEADMRDKLPRWNELDDICRLDDCRIDWSGFHPPPPTRKWMGDLAYLVFSIDGEEAVVNVTATRMGFYVNRSISRAKKHQFDPSPAAEPCYAHSLLDCLLQASSIFREKWAKALAASKERADLLSKLNSSPAYLSLFRVAVRADLEGFSTPAAAAVAAQSLDATLHTPSWIVPCPTFEKDVDKINDTAWNRNQYHSFLPVRAEEEMMTCFGVDLRTGGIRDWNEELQLAREMPTVTQLERVERARLLYKILMEFGEAALLGVKAITEGHVTPMNPNESMRTQVYLHNNIFFSRAVDAGPETFKLAKGDRAARKSANRDLQCISVFHRMEKLGLSTLATVLIDFLGTRFVCQSILPGILIGERAHKLLIGAVEAGLPLKWDKDLHMHLEDKLGESMMIASRPVLKRPLTDDRLEEINRTKKDIPISSSTTEAVVEDQETIDPAGTIMTCIPIEAKGILGSDQRRYLLDFGRLTPRDANWVAEEKGGTGKWEMIYKENGKTSVIAATLDDDEWTMCVLRPELVTRYTQHCMSKFLRQQKEKLSDSKKETSEGDTTKDLKREAGEESAKKDQEENVEVGNLKVDDPLDDEEDSNDDDKLSEDDLGHLKSLRLNVNVFLPDVKTLEGIDNDMFEAWKRDEQRVREASAFLWDDTLPKITRAVKDGTVHQIPNDGRTLTEFLHRNGVNCRYLGRLAMLAQEQEARDDKTEDDLKHNRLTVIERRIMPKCWLELLECEMVARAAKHVLDRYLIEHAGVGASQPAQVIASFLSALVSECEETAAQTETRLAKRAASEPDDDDFSALTISDIGGGGDAVLSPIRSRVEVWQDVEAEVGRRFLYNLVLFNNGNKTSRARHLPLLRRMCQRTGVRLVGRNFNLGGRCLTSGGNSSGGRLTGSYPISPLDIADIVPLMKHAAAHNEGFYPCLLYPTISLPPLQVSLLDARSALERAHIQTSGRALNRGLELAQEALTMFQRVTETAAHPAVIETMELMATIFLEGGDLTLAVSHGEKALGLAIQSGGFDAPNVVNAHLSLFQMLFSARELDRSVRHLRAAIYLLELMGGPNHTEVFSAYHKLGSAYSHADYDGRYLASAFKCFQEAAARDSCDRLMEGITSKNFAKVLAGMGNYKEAIESEKKAFRTLSMFLGKDHQWTKDSDEEMKKYAQLAEEKGPPVVVSENLKKEEAKADAVAADLAAEEEAANAKAKKKKKKGKK